MPTLRDGKALYRQTAQLPGKHCFPGNRAGCFTVFCCIEKTFGPSSAPWRMNKRFGENKTGRDEKLSTRASKLNIQS
jgi:hypothetical protein